MDDEADILDLIKHSLEKIDSNLCIDSVLSPQEALHAIQTKKFDMVITDYLMPETSGLELLAQVRQKQIEIPFIMLTGHSREEIVIQSLNAGIDYYLEKTSNFKAMSLELHHYINKIRVQQEIQARNQALLSLIPDLIIQLDKNGRYMSVHGNKRDLISPPDGILGKTLSEVLPEESAQLFMNQLQKALETGQLQTYEYELEIENTIYQFEGRMVPTIEKNQVLFIARNVTAQKIVENQLRQSQAQLARAHEIAKLGSWERNIKIEMNVEE